MPPSDPTAAAPTTAVDPAAPTQTPAPDAAAPTTADSVAAAPTIAVDPAALKAGRKKARKQLRQMHAMSRDDPAFDHVAFHALHYQAAGKPVPSIDPDDLDI
jgi:hypothetical protein